MCLCIKSKSAGSELSDARNGWMASLCMTGHLIRIMQFRGSLSGGERLFSLGNVRVFK